MQLKIEVSYSGEDVFEIKTQPSQVKLCIDKQKEGYTPRGPNPLEMFLSAMGGCIGVYAKRYLARHEIAFTKLSIDVRASLSQDPPMRLAGITVEVHTDAKLEDKRKIFEKFIRNCPIHNTLLHTKEVTIAID